MSIKSDIEELATEIVEGAKEPETTLQTKIDVLKILVATYQTLSRHEKRPDTESEVSIEDMQQRLRLVENDGG